MKSKIGARSARACAPMVKFEKYEFSVFTGKIINFKGFLMILDYFEKNYEQVKKEVRHEQAYLSQEIDKLGKLAFWPDDWVPSFKYKCCPSWIKSWFMAPSIPKGARVILFHGLPNPPEAIIGRSGKWYRHIQPSPWIKNYWTNDE